MSQIRTISGIDDETWNKAQQKYGNVSAKIKKLLQEDLEIEGEKLDLNIIESSDLTSKQKKVTKALFRQASEEKNAQQFLNLKENYYNRKDYMEDCDTAINEASDIPYKAKNGGIEFTELRCKCDASLYPKLLKQNDYECPKCGRKVVNL